MIPSSSSMITKLTVLCLCLIVGSLSSSTFKYSPDYKFYTGYGAGSAIKISSTEYYVAVGFTSGTLKIYDIYGNSQATCYGHSYPIIDIEWIPSYGWISLDSSGKAIRWSTFGTQQYTWQFNSSVIDMSVTTNYGYNYVGFNFGTVVLEYNATSASNSTTRIYTAPSYTTFTRIQYSMNYYQLYAATNTSYVQAYFCSTGGYYSQFYISYPGKYFTLSSTGQMAVINSYYVYKFNSTSYYSYFTYSGSANTVAVSYKDWNYQYITVDTTYNSYMYVYDNYGYYEQSLNYMYYTIKAMDASDNYLVAVDSYGYLSINSYSNPYYGGDFPGWLIGMIVGIILMVVIISVIINAVRRRKRKQAMLLANNYNRFDDQVSPVAPYFPNNQGYNPNPAQNQGWNANQNQGYNNAFNPVNPQQNQNPYQANQPNNWS